MKRIFANTLLLISLLSFFVHGAMAADHAESLSLGEWEIRMEVGETHVFLPSLMPFDYPMRALVWSSTDGEAFEIDRMVPSITALKEGTYWVYAESVDRRASDRCKVIVGSGEGNNPSVSKDPTPLALLSDGDLAKIEDPGLLNFIRFQREVGLDYVTGDMTSAQEYRVMADVTAGQEDAAAAKATEIGMTDVHAFRVVNAIAMQGSADQIARFLQEFPDAIRIYGDEMEFLSQEYVSSITLDVPTRYDSLAGNVRGLTNIDTVHALGLKGKGAVIAIVDTGIDSTNPEFAGRVIAEKCFSNNSKLLSARSVCEGGVLQGDKSAPVNALNPSEFNHGSMVAGIAVGKGGIAPEASIISIQIFSELPDMPEGYRATSYLSDQYLAYEYILSLADSGMKITAVNLSFGGGRYTSACDKQEPARALYFKEMIQRGILPITAAGNQGYNGKEGTMALSAPACISSAYAVSALSNLITPTLAGYTNYSANTDIAAPGSHIFSSLYVAEDKTYFDFTGSRTWSSDPPYYKEDDSENAYPYQFEQGTSLATPVMSGAFAILQQMYPGSDGADMRNFFNAISPRSVTNGKVRKNILDFSKIGSYLITKPYSAEAVGGTKAGAVNVSLTGVANADGYVAEFYDDGVLKRTVTSAKTKSNAGTAFTVTGLPTDTAYDVAVKAYKTVNNVKYFTSEEVTPVHVMSVPTGFGAVTEGDAIRAYWNGQTGYFYEVFADTRSNGSFTNLVCETGDGAGECLITSLPPNAIYYLRLIKHPVTQPEAISIPVTIEFGFVLAPNPDEYAWHPGSQQLWVTYEPHPGLTGVQFQLTYYNTKTKKDVVKTVSAVTASAPTDYLITGLVNNVDYTVRGRYSLKVGSKTIYSPYAELTDLRLVPQVQSLPQSVVVSATNASAYVTYAKDLSATGRAIQLKSIVPAAKMTTTRIKNGSYPQEYKIGSLVNGRVYKLRLFNYNLVSSTYYYSAAYPGDTLYSGTDDTWEGVPFVPMAAPVDVWITKENGVPTVRIPADSAATGMAALYSTPDGYQLGCEADGNQCTFSQAIHEPGTLFYVMKYKDALVDGETLRFYSHGLIAMDGTLVAKDASAILTEPTGDELPNLGANVRQMNGEIVLDIPVDSQTEWVSKGLSDLTDVPVETLEPFTPIDPMEPMPALASPMTGPSEAEERPLTELMLLSAANELWAELSAMGSLPATGFSTATDSSARRDLRTDYYKPGGMSLLIPVLDVDESLVYVPFAENTFDVEWLGNQIAMLEGSARPGEGLAVLAGHNHLNRLETGPFVYVSSLKENDRMFIRDDDGSLHGFKVTENFKIAATAVDDVRARVGIRTLVLLTCEDEAPDGTYLNRRVILAEPIG